MLPFIVLSAVVAGISASPNGPPLGACGTLTPAGHAASMYNLMPPPYNITISQDTYGPGSVIIVTLQETVAGNEFKGFILQARRTSGDMDAVLGNFNDTVEPGTQLLPCPLGSTFAHSNNGLKSIISTTWTAPMYGEGTLRFRATVVVTNSGTPRLSTYYENIISEDLTYDGPTRAPGIETTQDSDMMMTTNEGRGGAGAVRASVLTVLTVLMTTLIFRCL